MEISTPIANKFAFLIHFRYDIRDDLQYYWKPLKHVPENVYRKLFQHISFPSVKWGEVRSEVTDQDLGRNEIIPLNAEMFLDFGYKKINQRIDKTIDRLINKGYTNIGLGALTSPLTNGGLSLRGRKDISITNGNAYTAVSMYQGIKQLVETEESLRRKIAIVGASGSVGSCVAKLILKNNYADNLLLVARNANKLERLKRELLKIKPNAKLELSTDINDVRDAELITLLTTSTDCVIQPHHLKKDAVILDGTQPRNTSPLLTQERPDVTIVDGGIVHIPGISLKNGGFGLPDHHFFACFSETALLSIEGYNEHFSLGNPTLEQAEYIEELALKHKQHGFELAPFLSFGNPLSHSKYSFN